MPRAEITYKKVQSRVAQGATRETAWCMFEHRTSRSPGNFLARHWSGVRIQLLTKKAVKTTRQWELLRDRQAALSLPHPSALVSPISSLTSGPASWSCLPAASPGAVLGLDISCCPETQQVPRQQWLAASSQECHFHSHTLTPPQKDKAT